MPADLPLERTSFVGRARELAELERLIGKAAIVTVVGTGGVGKTRLALEAAHRLADRFPAGTRLADLGPIGSPELAVIEVARLAGVLPGWATRSSCSSSSSATAACCWCSTTASTWSRRSRCWPTGW